MKKAFLFFLVAFLSVASVEAQRTGVCGVSPADGMAITKRMLANRLAQQGIETIERGAVTYVPIHFHLAANTQGTGRHKEWLVLDQLCNLNAEYAPYDIQFYLSAHPTYGLFDKSIQTDNVYENQTGTFIMQARKHPNAINVYVVQLCVSGNPNSLGTVLGYYTPQWDWLVVRKDQTNGSGNGTLEHELGHFLSLPHPFQGWDFEVFDSNSPTWPKAPPLSPGGVPTEKMDGSNCTVAGDYICDTPPDYNLGFGWSGCSPYTGPAQDPNGVAVNPMENNFMGYFQNCSDYEFTPGQVAEMKADLNASNRNFLDNSYVPVATSLTMPSGDLLVSPAQNETTATNSNISLTWQPVTGATHYLVEVDIAPSFISTKLQSAIVSNQTSWVANNLDPNKTHYWRVRPFNFSTSCGTFPAKSFKTGAVSDVEDLPGVLSATLAPNPVLEGFDAILNISAHTSFKMQLRLTDAAGRIVSEQSDLQVAEGDNAFTVRTEGLPSGAYFLSLTSGNRTETKLLSILK